MSITDLVIATYPTKSSSVNTAIAISHNPSKMAQAFALSVQSGRLAYTAGLPVVSHDANASSPLTGFIHG